MDLVDFIVVQSQCLGEVERAIENFLYDCYDCEFEVVDLICNSAISILYFHPAKLQHFVDVLGISADCNKN